MSRLILLVEELSMKVLLDGLLPRLFPGLPFLCVSHEGKSDLEASLPRKLKGWREPGVRFLVVRDNDRGDCRQIKAGLQALCAGTGRSDVTIRIVCQELEAWYLGDPQALAVAFDRRDLGSLDAQARFRDPDAIANPADELRRLVPKFQKVSGARRMAEVLEAEGNSSRSFQALIESIRRHASVLEAESSDRDTY